MLSDNAKGAYIYPHPSFLLDDKIPTYTNYIALLK